MCSFQMAGSTRLPHSSQETGERRPITVSSARSGASRRVSAPGSSSSRRRLRSPSSRRCSGTPSAASLTSRGGWVSCSSGRMAGVVEVRGAGDVAARNRR